MTMHHEKKRLITQRDMTINAQIFRFLESVLELLSQTVIKVVKN